MTDYLPAPLPEVLRALRSATSPAARYFEAAWKSINGSYDPDALVWRIGLEAIR